MAGGGSISFPGTVIVGDAVDDSFFVYATGEFNGPQTFKNTANFTGTVTFSGSITGLPAASETIPGIIELATTAEAQALTDALRAITPYTLNTAFTGAANQLQAAAGFQVLPGGLILNWGITASTAGGAEVTVTFQKPFTSACYFATPIRLSNNSAQTMYCWVLFSAPTTTQATFTNGTAETGTAYWFAFGY